jgi:hypothetical protein
MKCMHNEFWVAVLADTVKPGVCLKRAGAAMCALPFTQIDQTTRNGP